MPWLVKLAQRKPPKLAAVALANKMARVAWPGTAKSRARKAAAATPRALAA